MLSEVRGYLLASVLLIACRYARRLILLVRICVMTELIALCVSMYILRIAFPGRTPSLKSSLPCLATSQDSSHSSLIAWRIMDLVAIRTCRESGSGGGSAFARVGL